MIGGNNINIHAMTCKIMNAISKWTIVFSPQIITNFFYAYNNYAFIL